MRPKAARPKKPAYQCFMRADGQAMRARLRGFKPKELKGRIRDALVQLGGTVLFRSIERTRVEQALVGQGSVCSPNCCNSFAQLRC